MIEPPSPYSTEHKHLSAIFYNGECLTLKRNTIYLQAGDTITHMHLIEEGAILSYRVGKRNEAIIHTFYGPGEIFPVSGIREIDSVGTTFEAIADTKLYRLPRAVFADLCSESNLAAYELAVQVTEQYAHYVQRVGNLQYTNAYDRVVYFLLLIAQRFGRLGEAQTIEITLPLTHQLIASTVNVARETASRAMKRLAQKGIVCKRTKRYFIVDAAALTAELHDKSIHIPIPFEKG